MGFVHVFTLFIDCGAAFWPVCLPSVSTFRLSLTATQAGMFPADMQALDRKQCFLGMCLNDDFSRQFYQLALSVHIRPLHNAVENKDDKTVLWIPHYFQGCF